MSFLLVLVLGAVVYWVGRPTQSSPGETAHGPDEPDVAATQVPVLLGASKPAPVAEADAAWRLPLESKPWKYRVRVTGHEFRPIPDTTVSIFSRDAEGRCAHLASADCIEGVAELDLAFLEKRSRNAVRRMAVAVFAEAPGHLRDLGSYRWNQYLVGADLEPARWTTELELRPDATVRGHVRWVDGSPVFNARVFLLVGDEWHELVHARPDGRYVLAVPSTTDEIIVGVVQEEAREARTQRIRVRPGTTSLSLDLTLRRVPATPGRVCYTDGRAVDDLVFAVDCTHYIACTYIWTPLYRAPPARTDAAGRFEIRFPRGIPEQGMAYPRSSFSPVLPGLPSTAFDAQADELLVTIPEDRIRLRVRVRDVLREPLGNQPVVVRAIGEAEPRFESVTDCRGEASFFLPHGIRHVVSLETASERVLRTTVDLPAAGKEHFVDVHVADD